MGGITGGAPRGATSCKLGVFSHAWKIHHSSLAAKHSASASHLDSASDAARAWTCFWQVGLSELLDKLGGLHATHSPQQWRAALSPGQRQLLACARICMNAPALVLLDEATSAMPVADEARIYAWMRERRIAYVSIGHRTSLEAYHDEVIELP